MTVIYNLPEGEGPPEMILGAVVRITALYDAGNAIRPCVAFGRAGHFREIIDLFDSAPREVLVDMEKYTDFLAAEIVKGQTDEMVVISEMRPMTEEEKAPDAPIKSAGEFMILPSEEPPERRGAVMFHYANWKEPVRTFCMELKWCNNCQAMHTGPAVEIPLKYREVAFSFRKAKQLLRRN